MTCPSIHRDQPKLPSAPSLHSTQCWWCPAADRQKRSKKEKCKRWRVLGAGTGTCSRTGALLGTHEVCKRQGEGVCACFQGALSLRRCPRAGAAAVPPGGARRPRGGSAAEHWRPQVAPWGIAPRPALSLRQPPANPRHPPGRSLPDRTHTATEEDRGRTQPAERPSGAGEVTWANGNHTNPWGAPTCAQGAGWYC